MSGWEIRQGDALALLREMPAESVDAIVTDPPYGLAFMGKAWDHVVPGVPFWVEALRVAKPGVHLVAFGGTRTYHRLACAIEDARWEIRDCLMWLYGSGFPKSLDVSKAIDKAAGVARDQHPNPRWLERYPNGPGGGEASPMVRQAARKADDPLLTSDPATDDARTWEGWGTALKPAWEPIILARKPLAGTVAANVLEHGTGALNVGGCRIGTSKQVPGSASNHPRGSTHAEEWGYGRQDPKMCGGHDPNLGRWPANVLLDEEAARLLDEQSGESQSRIGMPRGATSGEGWGMTATGAEYSDSGGASRFFYTAKASSGERHYAGKNTHPTVKPVDLMRWLVRLVTPSGGLVLDPFTGSGSTGVAALAEGARFLGIELDPEHVVTARRRIAGPLFAEAQP